MAVSLTGLIFAGCAGFEQVDGVTEAIRAGRISDLPASSNYFVAGAGAGWGLEGTELPAGPYSKISSLEVIVHDGTTSRGSYVFFCGKSDETKEWEIFSCMKWQTNAWRPVPVNLDKSPIQN